MFGLRFRLDLNKKNETKNATTSFCSKAKRQNEREGGAAKKRKGFNCSMNLTKNNQAVPRRIQVGLLGTHKCVNMFMIWEEAAQFRSYTFPMNILQRQGKELRTFQAIWNEWPHKLLQVSHTDSRYCCSIDRKNPCLLHYREGKNKGEWEFCHTIYGHDEPEYVKFSITYNMGGTTLRSSLRNSQIDLIVIKTKTLEFCTWLLSS